MCIRDRGDGLPAAIGAYYATGKPTACICGDGALQMNIQELELSLIHILKKRNVTVMPCVGAAAHFFLIRI